MTIITDVLSELVSMFLADRLLSLGIIAVIALAVLLTKVAGLPPLIGGLTLLVGTLVLLIESVRRHASGPRAP